MPALLLVTCVANHCGSKPKAGETEQGKENFELTAEYAEKAVDILVLLEKTYALEQQPFKERLQIAAGSFAARLTFEQYDYSLAIGSTGMPPKKGTPNAAVEAEGLLRAEGTPAVLRGDNPTLKDLIEARFASPRIDKYSHQPLASLRRILNSEDNTKNFFREGARLAVMFVSYSDEREEQLIPDDLKNLLDKKKGEGNWMVAAIAPPIGGCVIDEEHNRKTQDEGDERRDLVKKLQERTPGLFLSICEPSYTRFFDKFLFEGTGNGGFNVELPQKAMWSSIKVLAGEKVLTGWKYKPGQTTLVLPTSIQKGTKIKVEFEIDDGTKPNVVDETKLEPPVLSERKLSPQEQQFLTDVNPIFQRSCGGCHGAGSAQTQYVDKFANAVVGKAMILERIRLPADNPAHMPKGGTLPQADIDKIVTFLESLK